MQRLELTWIGKGEDPEVEPRILIHDPSKDFGDSDTGNMLIHGDNLLALKALEQDYSGKINASILTPHTTRETLLSTMTIILNTRLG